MGHEIYPPQVEIVALPFPKFFNANEDLNIDVIEKLAEEFQITSKIDGSLGIIFYNKIRNTWDCCTKASFTSEQSNFVKKFLSKLELRSSLIPGHTYLVEIVYTSNRIIIDYGDFQGIIFLSAFDQIGIEYPFWKLERLVNTMITDNFKFIYADGQNKKIKMVNIIKKFKTFKEIETYLSSCTDEEGFVIKYKIGNGYHRFKWKSQDYLEKQKIQQKLSPKSILKELKKSDEHVLEMRDKIPEELHDWFDKIVDNFTNQVEMIIKKVKIQLHIMEKYGNHTKNKKTVVEWFDKVGMWSDGKPMTKKDKSLILKAYTDNLNSKSPLQDFDKNWIQKKMCDKMNKNRMFIFQYVNVE